MAATTNSEQIENSVKIFKAVYGNIALKETGINISFDFKEVADFFENLCTHREAETNMRLLLNSDSNCSLMFKNLAVAIQECHPEKIRLASYLEEYQENGSIIHRVYFLTANAEMQVKVFDSLLWLKTIFTEHSAILFKLLFAREIYGNTVIEETVGILNNTIQKKFLQ